MVSDALFDFFEIIAEELVSTDSKVITSTDFAARGQSNDLISELMSLAKVSDPDYAIKQCVDLLRSHFLSRGSELPFAFDPSTSTYSRIDLEYLTFINNSRSIRSVGKRSRDFECSVAERFFLRVTGAVHRVGFPRDVHKTKPAFLQYIKNLGFKTKDIVWGNDKDGGMDILWTLPIGAVPHAPILSLQCKNGIYNVAEAAVSLDAGRRSLDQHRGLFETIHVPCVLFNDYVFIEKLETKRMNFVPLGLSDLAALSVQKTLHLV